MNFTLTQQPITWFRDRYRDGTLKIRPPFQRKPVWVARQKCSLIESILLGLPIPEVYVQHITTPDGQTTFAVVDGQQRIRTVLQFIGAENDPDEQVYNKFILDKLPPESEWYNSTFASLGTEQRRRFYEYSFAVTFLYTHSEEEVRNMFERLNRYLMPLKPQELRNARYTGPFVRLALDLGEDEYWSENRIVSPTMIRRMGDVEFISELLIGVMHGPQGGSSAVIDEYYAQYEDYEDEFPYQRATKKLFQETLQFVQTVLPGIKETRWRNKTDFYSLFVALAAQLRQYDPLPDGMGGFAQALDSLSKQIDIRFADETAVVTNEAVTYVRAVEKGANDKPRRAARHLVLLDLLKPYFSAKG